MRGKRREWEGGGGNEREREGLRGNEGSSLQADRQDKIQYHKEKLRNPKVKQRSTAGKKMPEDARDFTCGYSGDHLPSKRNQIPRSSRKKGVFNNRELSLKQKRKRVSKS